MCGLALSRHSPGAIDGHAGCCGSASENADRRSRRLGATAWDEGGEIRAQFERWPLQRNENYEFPVNSKMTLMTALVESEIMCDTNARSIPN